MNEILTAVAKAAMMLAFFALLVGSASRRLAWTTVFVTSLVLATVADGTTTDHALHAVTAAVAAGCYISEVRKQVRS